MKGRWEDIQKPYKAKEIKDDKAPEWRIEVQREKKLHTLKAAGNKPSKSGSLEESRYNVIMEMRNDSGFAAVAKGIPPPTKPASMNKPPAPAPLPVSTTKLASSLQVTLPVALSSSAANSPASLKRKAPGDITTFKKEVIDVDDDDDDDDEPKPGVESDYEPEDEDTNKRENRAKKRQRTGDFATQLKQSASEEDLEFQLKEHKLKTQLQEMQLQHKLATLKRRKQEGK